MTSNEEQFRNELNNNFMMTQHQNIVKLVGYCYDSRRLPVEHDGENIFGIVEERILCFEYLQAGSLDKYISGTSFFFYKEVLSGLLRSYILL
jgi:hypothetical protein